MTQQIALPFDIVYAREISGMSWADIAEKIGVSPEAARSLFRRRKEQKVREAVKVIDDLVPEVSVTGVTPDSDLIPPDVLWRDAIGKQRRAAATSAQKRVQVIEIHTDRPIGIAHLSDMHLGDPMTDYEAAKNDAEIIATTDGMYCEYHGDGWDNWIIAKLMRLQRGQAMSFPEEMQLFRSYLSMFNEKLLWAIPGNHDLWTEAQAGLDWLREILRGTQILYDAHEIVFDLKFAGTGTKWRYKARHKWRYSSIFNPTHGIETGWERGSDDFDVGIGGHTHIGTLCRPFFKHDRVRYAMMTGTYKVGDGFGTAIGVARTVGRGCGVMIYWPDGRLQFFYDVKTAAEFLMYLRNK